MLERGREGADVDVVSIQTEDSFWEHLRTCGKTLPISIEVGRESFIAELETETDTQEEVRSTCSYLSTF